MLQGLPGVGEPLAGPVVARARHIAHAPSLRLGNRGATSDDIRRAVPEAVLVLEDDPVVRRGIVSQLAQSGEYHVVGEAADLATAGPLIASKVAKLGIFDLQLRDGNSIALIPSAVESGMSVLVLTIWDDDESVYDALTAGAGGYLLKGDASAGRITEALTILRQGGAPISPLIARRLLDDFRARPAPKNAPQDPHDDASTLTAREREIIELFAKGSTYDEVANMLKMSVNTVRHHVRNIYRKLHVCSKTEAVSAAFRLEG